MLSTKSEFAVNIRGKLKLNLVNPPKKKNIHHLITIWYIFLTTNAIVSLLWFYDTLMLFCLPHNVLFYFTYLPVIFINKKSFNRFVFIKKFLFHQMSIFFIFIFVYNPHKIKSFRCGYIKKKYYLFFCFVSVLFGYFAGWRGVFACCHL